MAPLLHHLPFIAAAPPRPNSLAQTADAWPTLRQLLDTLTFNAGFNTSLVMLGSTLLGLAAGVVGVFTLLRNRSLTTDALSHATLPGIALAFLLAPALALPARSLPLLLLGAALTGVLGILAIQAILRFSRLKEDAAIGIVLSVFFGAGIVLLSYIQANAPSGSAGLTRFIYGQAATMQPADVTLMAAIAALAILATLLLTKELALTCFNDAFARVLGYPVSLLDLLILTLVVLVTVAGIQAVGLIMVVSLLIIPPVAARFWTERLSRMILVAALLGALSGYLGSALSALLPRKPAGAVIVLTASALFTISLIVAPARGLIASSLRRLRLRLRIAADHLLERAHHNASTTLPRADLDRLARLRAWSTPFRLLVLASLRRNGLLASTSRHALHLTPDALAHGSRVARNHALWEQYLTACADVAPSHVDWSVDQVEHVLSEPLVRELEAQLRARGLHIPPATPLPHTARASTP